MPYADPRSDRAFESRRKASRRYYYKNRGKEIARSRNWNVKHMDQVKAVSIERRSKRTPVEKVLYFNAKNRAKAKGILFNIDITDIVVPRLCPVLDIPLIVSTGHAKANSPSLDRVDPTKGYVKGNIVVVSHKANTIKSNATIAELERVLSWLRRRVE